MSKSNDMRGGKRERGRVKDRGRLRVGPGAGWLCGGGVVMMVICLWRHVLISGMRPEQKNRLEPLISGVNDYAYDYDDDVPFKLPQSRDEAWKANIPHTHLAHEKSDKNWMVVKGDKIVFPRGGTHFHYGADKYIASIANVRLIGYLYKAE
ncbi:hypothetical protein RJT34_12958 [Clitoria ternatea]|uniref:Methyltransferase n=1 Tax=Clitoria ternatea TaxID=43366 RepID=A0AAN9JR87_CLITE